LLQFNLKKSLTYMVKSPYIIVVDEREK